MFWPSTATVTPPSEVECRRIILREVIHNAVITRCFQFYSSFNVSSTSVSITCVSSFITIVNMSSASVYNYFRYSTHDFNQLRICSLVLIDPPVAGHKIHALSALQNIRSFSFRHILVLLLGRTEQTFVPLYSFLIKGFFCSLFVYPLYFHSSFLHSVSQ